MSILKVEIPSGTSENRGKDGRLKHTGYLICSTVFAYFITNNSIFVKTLVFWLQGGYELLSFHHGPQNWLLLSALIT